MGRKLGGLASMAAAINSLLAGALVGTIAYLIPVTMAGLFRAFGVTDFNAAIFGLDAAEAGRFIWSGALAITLGGLFFICQTAWLRNEEDTVKEKLGKGRPTHAGGIVYRLEGRKVEWLIVGRKGSKKTKSKDRFFPRGKIEPGEGHGEAALREVHEETGVVARLVGLVDRVAFKDRDKNIDAKFYLMTWLYETDPAGDENRVSTFVTAEEAFRAFEHPESKHLLQEAMRMRDRLFASPKSQRTPAKNLPD